MGTLTGTETEPGWALLWKGTDWLNWRSLKKSPAQPQVQRPGLELDCVRVCDCVSVSECVIGIWAFAWFDDCCDLLQTWGYTKPHDLSHPGPSFELKLWKLSVDCATNRTNTEWAIIRKTTLRRTPASSARNRVAKSAGRTGGNTTSFEFSKILPSLDNYLPDYSWQSPHINDSFLVRSIGVALHFPVHLRTELWERWSYSLP